MARVKAAEKIRKAAAMGIAVLVVLAIVGAAPFMTGCDVFGASPSVNQQNSDDLVRQEIEQSWAEEVENAKQQLNTWYQENVISEETISGILGYSSNLDWDSNPCVLENGLPKYRVIDSLIGIPSLIRDIKAELDSYDTSEIKTKGEIKPVVDDICSQYGFTRNAAGKFDFENENFPGFGDQSEVDDIVVAVGDWKNAVFLFNNTDIFAPYENGTVEPSVYEFFDTAKEKRTYSVDGTTYSMMVSCGARYSRNGFFATNFFERTGIVTVTKDGEELTIIGISAEEVFYLLDEAEVFLGSKEYNECKDYVIKGVDWKSHGITPYSEYIEGK